MNSLMLHYVRYVMILSGTLPVHLISSHKRFYTIYQYVVQMSLSIFLIIMYTPFLRKLEHTETMAKVISDIILFTTVYIKGRVFVSRNMNKLITDLVNYEAKLKIIDDSTIEEIYKKVVKKSKLIQMAYLVSSYCCSSTFIIPHYVNYFMSSNSTRSTLYIWLLPFDQEKHHLTVLLLQSYCLELGMFYYCSITIMLIVLPLHIILRLKVLKTKLKNIAEMDAKTENNLSDIRRKITMCIEEHIDIIRNCSLLNDTVKYIMLLEFLLSSFQFALCVIQVITTAKSAKTIFNVGFVIVSLIQLLTLYWYANQIRDESLDVVNVVYALPWYDYDKKLRTTVCLIIMRSQKPLTLTVGPFGNMTLEMFVKIVKGIYTYITFMQQTYKTD